MEPAGFGADGEGEVFSHARCAVGSVFIASCGHHVSVSSHLLLAGKKWIQIFRPRAESGVAKQVTMRSSLSSFSWTAPPPPAASHWLSIK